MAMKLLTLLLILSTLLISFAPLTTSIPTEDLDVLLTLLRSNGHALFANAISTSDLLFDLISLPSLTLLAPTDPSVFALDMTQTPSFYLSTLRLHALPLHLSWSRFLQLPNASSLPTLLPSSHLRLITGGHLSGDILLVADDDGSAAVPVIMPGLYYGSQVAVHGLAGILTSRFKTPAHANRTVFFKTPVPRVASTPPHFTPRIPEILPHVRKNHTNRTVKDFSPSPVNRTVVASPPVDHAVVSPPPNVEANSATNVTNRTDSSSPLNFTVAVSSPVPGPDGNSPAEVPKVSDVSKWMSTEFVMSPDNAIAADEELGVEIPEDW